jgi:hypothetical protein
LKTLFGNILKPEFVMPYGVNQGYSLSEIYQHLPTYIEWLIENIPSFQIEPRDFEVLSRPMIYFPVYGKVIVRHGMSLKKVREAVTFREVDFKFSKQTKKILLQKKLGVFANVLNQYYHIHYKVNLRTIADLYQYELEFS